LLGSWLRGSYHGRPDEPQSNGSHPTALATFGGRLWNQQHPRRTTIFLVLLARCKSAATEACVCRPGIGYCNWSAPNRSALAKSVFAASLALWTTPPCWRYFQIQERELKTKAIKDPRAAVTADVASLRAIPALPGQWILSGLVYDVVMWQPDLVRSSCYQR
jgi:hypothetical protein